MTRGWKTYLTRAILVGVMALLGACVEITQPRATVTTPGVSLDSLIAATLDMPPDVERPLVLERLAPPLHQRVIPYPNRHIPGQIDIIRVLYYDGLELAVYDVSHSGKAFIIYLKVTSPDYETQEGLRVGKTRAEVETVLGMPDVTENSSSIYNLSDAGDQLIVAFKENLVTGLEWQFYWD